MVINIIRKDEAMEKTILTADQQVNVNILKAIMRDTGMSLLEAQIKMRDDISVAVDEIRRQWENGELA